MKDLTVEDLLLNISDHETDRAKAETSFSELYWRFSEKLEGSVRGHLKSKGMYNPDLINTIVSNVFNEVFLKPLNFTYDKNQDQSEETKFRAWLYRIARNVFADLMSASIQYTSRNVVGIDDDLVERYAEIAIEEEALKGNREMLEKAMSILSERERHILLACYDYYEEGKNTPSEVLDMLCEYWGTTRENVRQIKKRSLDKVKKQLEMLTLLKPAK
jgi:RNA polymerase sigma factor (sigma-70 family)